MARLADDHVNPTQLPFPGQDPAWRRREEQQPAGAGHTPSRRRAGSGLAGRSGRSPSVGTEPAESGQLELSYRAGQDETSRPDGTVQQHTGQQDVSGPPDPAAAQDHVAGHDGTADRDGTADQDGTAEDRAAPCALSPQRHSSDAPEGNGADPWTGACDLDDDEDAGGTDNDFDDFNDVCDFDPDVEEGTDSYDEGDPGPEEPDARETDPELDGDEQIPEYSDFAAWLQDHPDWPDAECPDYDMEDDPRAH